jgi:hypothetical protein
MLSNLYYFFGIFILLSVISQLLKYNQIFSLSEWYEKFEKVTGKKPLKKDFRSESDWYIFMYRNPLLIFEGFWIIFGFITNNWFIFLFMVIYTKLIGFIFNKFKYNIISKYLYLNIFLIKIIIYGLIIINHFHLKLDLWIIFKDFLQFQ